MNVEPDELMFETTGAQPTKSRYFEAEPILSKLNCPNCENRFETPLNMPCSHNICNNCFKNLKVDAFNTIECPVCSAQNKIPETGFPVNTLLTDLLALETIEVKRGKYLESLFDACKHALNELNQIIADFNERLNTSEQRLKSYFMHLKEEINSSANSKIDQLNKYRNELLKQVEEYQTKCVLNFEDSLKLQRRELIDKSLFDLDQWRQESSSPSSDEIDLENIKIQVENLKFRLESERDQLDSQLFDNQRWRFVKDEHLLTQDSIGFFQIEKEEEGYATLNESDIYNK